MLFVDFMCCQPFACKNSYHFHSMGKKIDDGLQCNTAEKFGQVDQGKKLQENCHNLEQEKSQILVELIY